MGLFYCLNFGRDAMCKISNAEVFNRWKFAEKQAARNYWFNFLNTRANYGDKNADQYVNTILIRMNNDYSNIKVSVSNNTIFVTDTKDGESLSINPDDWALIKETIDQQIADGCLEV